MTHPQILLISSANPLVGAGRVALDYYKAFTLNGYDIDFMTLLPVKGYPEVKHVYEKSPVLRNLFNKILYRLTGLRKTKPGFCFFYSYEQLPEVPVRKVLKRINRNYDLVLILFWQGMLSYKTIQVLYNRLHCQIHFMGVDYSHMSGGCHFTCDCQRFQEGCGKCPAIYSNRLTDFTYYNVKFRKNIFETVKPVVYGNLYMREIFYAKSSLLKGARIEASTDIYDIEEFKPMDQYKLKEKYGISKMKKFVMFFGCQNLDDPRKGMVYLLDSLNFFWKQLTQEERNEIQVVVAGKQFKLIADKIDFETFDLGFVNMSQIPEIYAMSDVFLSPSVDDAGPMMVNQSLTCGTPVVAFEMGTALESIKDNPIGYCAKMKDSTDFANGIDYIYRLSDEEKNKMRKKCRDYAVNHFSYEARIKNIEEVYNKYKTY